VTATTDTCDTEGIAETERRFLLLIERVAGDQTFKNSKKNAATPLTPPPNFLKVDDTPPALSTNFLKI
jgi:hypothetical protein